MSKAFFSLIFALMVVVSGCSSPIKQWVLPTEPPMAPTADPSSHPNIIFILTDDLDMAGLDYMPKVKALLSNQGVSFSDFLISMALCCPSRSCILRGQYPHNTQILGNVPPRGGFERFHELGSEESTVGVWLQAAGYRTALIGKYLNGYPKTVEMTYVPPGWDEWYSPVKGAPYRQVKFTLNENGKLVDYGTKSEDYGTDVYTNKALDFMGRSIQAGQPFFAFISVYAPHTPAPAAPRHKALFNDVSLPRSPSFNEEDVSDKPDAIRNLPLITDKQIGDLENEFRKRLRSLQSVDEMVEKIVQSLQAANQLENTYIFFTSDNGYHMGQHRLMQGKNTAYEEDIRVPLIIRGPGVPAAKVVDALAGNIDLASTFADIARAAIPAFVDGRSLLPWLGDSPPAKWRAAFLLEKGDPNDEIFGEGSGGGEKALIPIIYSDDGILEPPDSLEYDLYLDVAFKGEPFRGIRTAECTYLEFENGERELYNLRKDPYQLENIAGSADETLLRVLSAWLDSLNHCTAAECRTAEEFSPPEARPCFSQ